PISAWISPCFTSRFTPLRIRFSSTATHKLLIFRTLFILLYAEFRTLDLGFRISLDISPLSALHFEQLRYRRISAVMRHRQIVAGAAHQPLALDLVLDSHQSFEQSLGPGRTSRD